MYNLNPKQDDMTASKKVMTIDELTAMVRSMIRKKVKPVKDVDAYYQKYRKVKTRLYKDNIN
jgi:hypothetical protein